MNRHGTPGPGGPDLDLQLALDCRTMVESSLEARIITDQDGQILFANSCAHQLGDMLGFATGIGESISLFDSGRFGTKAVNRLHRALHDERVFDERLCISASADISLPVLGRGAVPREEQVWLDVSVRVLSGEPGDACHIAFVLRDVTEDVRRADRVRINTEGIEARVKISAVLSSDAPLKDRFEQAVGIVLEMEQLAIQKKGGVFLLEENDDRLRMFAHVGKFTHQFLKDEAEVELGACLCGRAAVSGEIVISDNCFEDERHEHSWPNMSPHGHYIVPLMDESTCVGVLFLYTDVNPTHKSERIDALLQIGNLMANAIVRDRHDRRMQAASERLREAQTRFELAIEGSRDAIFDWNLEEDSVYYSSRWGELLGRDGDTLDPTIATLLEHVASSDIHRIEREIAGFMRSKESHFDSEFRLMSSEGNIVWALMRAAALRDASGGVRRLSGSVADISSIKAVEEEMRRLVQQDQLTGLSSRGRLLERLQHALARSERTQQLCAILFFDFDRFKVVNDSLGHDVGDELLCSIAQRLRSNIREVDTAARFGGDEFVVLLEDLPDADSARATADKLLEVCAQPHDIRGHRLVSTASIGVVTNAMSADGPASMLRDADAAMYQAKSSGRGKVVEFDKAMHDAMLERLALEEDIRNAIADNQFSLVYQPIVNLETGQPIGAEALARWHHPERGMVSPGVFIPIAEESSQIQDLGDWVLRDACRQIVEWKQRQVIPDGFTVSINLSKAQLMSPGFVEHLISVVASFGLGPSDLKLEVTETTIVDNRAGVADVLRELRSSGFVVMMDDFGTGHSSLSGLHALPIDELKIDQSFIRHEDGQKEIIAITSSIVTLASYLSLRTVGEGIETMSHVALLQNLGCHYGQGVLLLEAAAAGGLRDVARQSDQ